MPETPDVFHMDRLPTTKRLVQVLAEVTGKPWEISAIPKADVDDEKRPVKPPFGILYPLNRREGERSMANDRRTVGFVYQATLTALRGDQLDLLDDRVNQVLYATLADGSYAHDLSTPGRSVMDREFGDSSTDEPPAGALDIIQSSTRFTLWVTADTKTLPA